MKCAFCEILEDHKENETFICKMEYGSLYLHMNQLHRGRCIYILNRHFEDFTKLGHKLFYAFNKELFIISKTVKKIFQPDLINIAMLGNHVRHLHWHVVPRYKNDPNWGSPPWPSKFNKTLKKEEYINLALLIRNALNEDKDEKN